MYRLSTYCIDEKVILTPRHRIRTWVGHRRVNFYVQRVEAMLYKSMGWSELHYIDRANGTFNKGCHSFIFTDTKGRCVAFVALLNKTHRGCSNGMMVSRFVIAPQFQHRGYSMVLLNVVGAMLSACGYILYFNTRLKWLGGAMDKNSSWVGTHDDGRFRDKPNDPKCKNRTGGYACRKRYIGKSLRGYSELFLKIGVLKVKYAHIEVGNGVANVPCTDAFIMSFDTIELDDNVCVYNIIRYSKGVYNDSS